MDKKILEFPNIKQLIEEKRKLLENNPKAQVFQNKIDEALNKAGNNQYNKLIALKEIAKELNIKLLNELDNLKKELIKFKKLLKDSNDDSK